ncbi:MAG: CAP domain-containing protein [Oscillospiraceae bacterium]|jgi:uncharacterized protein YkwD|nr:CAP domain-containing protein [Oscillospiraceae bacterium]
MKRKVIYISMCFALVLGAVIPARAASEQETAAAYLVQRGIFKGDENGNLNLGKGLTRAELAAILSRIDGAEQLWDTPSQEGNNFRYGVADYYIQNCGYTDVPAWALLYVGYCNMQGLMQGYSAAQFGSNDPVNPNAICTVMLRWLGYAETDWSYDASVAKAQTAGITPSGGLSGDTALRGDVAIVVYKALLQKDATTPETPSGTDTPTPASPVGEPTEAEMYAMAEEVVQLVNVERAAAGLREVVLKPELMEVARWKSQDMVDYSYYSHFSPNLPNGGQTGQAIQQLNIRGLWGCYENLATGDSTPQNVVTGWMGSEGHRENILDSNRTHVGVGIAYNPKSGGYLMWTLILSNWTDKAVDQDSLRDLPYIEATSPATAYTPLKTK